MTRKELFDRLYKPSKTNKVLLLTHNDEDAAGAEIVCRNVFSNITVKNFSNNEMSKGILTEVQDNANSNEFDLIIIADISCNEEDAVEVNKVVNNCNIVLLDHHPTAVHLNKYKWAKVESSLLDDSFMVSWYKDVDNTKAHSSGASLVYDYLDYNNLIESNNKLKYIIHLIAAHDTWDWFDILGQNEAYDTLDRLSDIYGIEIFVQEMLKRIQDSESKNSLFTDTDRLLLSIEQNKINSYKEHIKKVIKESKLLLDNNLAVYEIAWCFTSQYISETFDLMKELYPEKDLYIINFGSGISLRSRTNGINVGQLAKEVYNGGGHPGAAGFSISKEITHKYFEDIMHGVVINLDKENNNNE